MTEPFVKRHKKQPMPPHIADFIPPTVHPCLTSKNCEIEKENQQPQSEISPNAKPIIEQNTDKHQSYSYFSAIPEEIKANPSEDIILGIDEAGRGPVLGSMVYSVAYCRASKLPILKENDFDDSKKLTDVKRAELFYAMCVEDDAKLPELQKSLRPNIGYAITNLTARDISSEMLNSVVNNNLNNQAHDTTINLIQNLLNILNKYNVTEVYIDTVGPPVRYQDKLSKIFPQLKITVSKKADSIYPIVSAASVVAKVTRDIILHQYQLLTEHEYGSGYPSDPKTTHFLSQGANKVFGWGPVVRYSWQTAKTLLQTSHYANIIWEDDIKRKKIDYGNIDLLMKDQSDNDINKLQVSTWWYGENVVDLN